MASQDRRLKACVVSDGGADAFFLQQAGDLIRSIPGTTILYELSGNAAGKPDDFLENFGRANGVECVRLPTSEKPAPVEPFEITTPYHVYEWLKARPFDVILFPAGGGFAFYAICAKRQGLGFENTVMVVAAHMPSLRRREADQASIDDPALLELDFLEQRCVESCDLLIAADAETLNWMRARDWRLCPRVRLARGMPDEWERGNVESLIEQTRPAPTSGRPRLSVCLTHFNRPHFLRQSVQSLLDQSESEFEVVLVDDGSTVPEAETCLKGLEPVFARRGWRIVRQDNRYLGAARNRAARESRGEYLLFMDDDDWAKPHEIATFVRAAVHSNADVLTCFADILEYLDPPSVAPASLRFLPTGGPAVCGVFENRFGTAHALVRRAVFEAVGGFAEARDAGCEDYEFYGRAALAGYRIEVVPEALFWYRTLPTGMRLSMNPFRSRRRALSPYVRAMPSALESLVPVAHGLYEDRKRHAERMRWLQADLRRREDEILSMKGSWSWRITAPLRGLHRWLVSRRGRG
jgi:glycosyltransferase involved in cell wall biosynthesis